MTSVMSNQWLLFELAGQTYGFDVNHVREIVSLQKQIIHRMPQSAAFIEGVITLRSQPIEVMEVRSAFGLCSLRDETEQILAMLREREEDHCRWIEELEASVREQREFRLARDPHRCKFGQWYDKVLADPSEVARLTNNDLAAIDLLENLDLPHKQIHSIADHVTDYVSAGNVDAARQLIDESRHTTLKLLREVFAKSYEQIEVVRRGLLFVLADGDDVFGALVDRVSEVVRLSDDQIRSIEGTSLQNGMLAGVAQLGDSDRMVQLLNVPAIARWRLRKAGIAVATESPSAAPPTMPSLPLGDIGGLAPCCQPIG